MLESLLAFLAIAVVFMWFARRARKGFGGGGGGLGAVMGIGKSKAKVYDEERPSIRFADIAGYEAPKAR